MSDMTGRQRHADHQLILTVKSRRGQRRRRHCKMPSLPKVQGTRRRMILRRKSRASPDFLVLSGDRQRTLFELRWQEQEQNRGQVGSWNLQVTASSASQVQTAQAPYFLRLVRYR